MTQYIYGDIRIQFFSEEIIRIEQSKDGRFCDENTFFVPNKSNYLHTKVGFTVDETGITFGKYRIRFPKNRRTLLGLSIEKEGKTVYRYKKLANTGELPPPAKTPCVFALSDSPRIVVPDNGYSYCGNINSSGYVIDECVRDVYLFLCEKDAKKLRKLFVGLTGQNELVRLSVLGGWNSRYYAYTEETAGQLIEKYERHDIPLDVMVIDTDWRECKNGWGYDVNRKLFPDMERFLDYAHSHGVEIMFNDHPEPVDGASVFEPREVKYREENLQKLLNIGLDAWWYDRNWTTCLISPTKGVSCETFGLYLYYDITKNYFSKRDGENFTRPVIMGNVNDVFNGQYRSIKDSASHRYSVQWTGDNLCDLDSLTREIENLIKCSDNCIPYVNSDCGGHRGDPGKELFVRWMQFGTLSPVFRPHCDDQVKCGREPWAYDRETEDIVKEYIALRYRLLPIIYKNAFNNYVCGEPIFKSLGYEYSTDKKAWSRTDEYMLGNDILIAPIAGNKREPIAEKNYISPVKALFYAGTERKGEPIATAEWSRLLMKLHNESPTDGVPMYDFSARFETTVRFNEKVLLYIKTDDGATVYVDGNKVLEDKSFHSAKLFPLCPLAAKESHKIEIEYFQAAGDAFCGLYAEKVKEDDFKEVYLPVGKWMDVFDGTIYDGGKTVCKRYGLRSMPLFVRVGALLPLAYEAKNTKEQKWNRLTFDFYPDAEARDRGYLYEDDTVTVAYKKGEYRKSEYEAYYDGAKKAFIVTLYAAEGDFKGSKSFDNREIKIKYHLLSGAKDVKSVVVNGKETAFSVEKKDDAAFPFNVGDSACDGDCLSVKLNIDVKRQYEICFYLS